VTFASDLNAAVAAGVCNWLNTGGNAVLGSAIWQGARVPGGQVPALAAGLGLLAVNAGCAFDPGNTVSSNTSGLMNSTCAGATHWVIKSTGAPTWGAWRDLFLLSEYEWVGWNASNVPVWRKKSDGSLFQATEYNKNSAQVGYGTNLNGTPAPCPGGPVLTPNPLPPFEYTGTTTNCTYVVEHLAWDVGPDGVAAPVVKVSSKTARTMATGGVIGGCNFSPVVYRGPGGGGGGGDGITFPWAPGPDDDGEPWWMPLIRGAAGGAAGAVVSKLLDEIFKEKVPADVYRLVSVCELDADGEPVSQVREVQLPSVPILNGIVQRLDAMEVLMQGLKDFKQPTCARPRPQGELVTVNFRSQAHSIESRQYLRKQLRYRDNANLEEAEHVAHWEGFEWQAGPAIVTSKGASWGIVQVWASDKYEGRRVIEHAASIAGVNLQDREHSWVDSVSRSSRYGRSGLMAVERTIDGRPCISKRVGPSGQPSWMLNP
jgi:hypothetical protein